MACRMREDKQPTRNRRDTKAEKRTWRDLLAGMMSNEMIKAVFGVVGVARLPKGCVVEEAQSILVELAKKKARPRRWWVVGRRKAERVGARVKSYRVKSCLVVVSASKVIKHRIHSVLCGEIVPGQRGLL